MSTPESHTDLLGPDGEETWQTLRQHVEWTQGFWVAWLFTGFPPLARELEARMEAFLTTRGQRQLVLRPSTPGEARDLLAAILDEDTRGAHCVWVEILHGDAPVGEEGDAAGEEVEVAGQIMSWAEAWDWLMMRANERRGALEAHLPGGLIFIGTTELKARARTAAPDLWSIRSLVLEPASPALHLPLDLPFEFDPVHLLRGDEAALNVKLALSQAARMRAQSARKDEVTALLRAVRGLLARGETREAIQRASEAVRASGEDDALRAEALIELGNAELEHGDPVAAERHLTQVKRLPGAYEFDKKFAALLCADLLRKRGALDEAERMYREVIEHARAQLARASGLHFYRTMLAEALLRLGVLLQNGDRLKEAEEVLREGLAHSRERRKATMPDGIHFRLQQAMLGVFIRQALEQGQLTNAVRFITDAMTKAQRRHAGDGLPAALRALRIWLEVSARIARTMGDEDAARTAEAALAALSVSEPESLT